MSKILLVFCWITWSHFCLSLAYCAYFLFSQYNRLGSLIFSMA